MNQPSTEKSGQQKRFVILRHHFPAGAVAEFSDHFDLMLEQESKLATWRIEAIPDPDQAVSATRLADHRKVYLDYEGPVSGDRGTVEQVIAGTYEICQDTESCLDVLLTTTNESIRLKIVAGEQGSLTVVRIGSADGRSQ
jgi:hypothetical protein